MDFLKSCPMSMNNAVETARMKVCQGEYCMWWDEDAQDCALSIIAKSLRRMSRNG